MASHATNGQAIASPWLCCLLMAAAAVQSTGCWSFIALFSSFVPFFLMFVVLARLNLLLTKVNKIRKNYNDYISV